MPKTSTILLDTHALLWWRSDSLRLPDSTRDIIDSAEVRLLSPISLWEVAMLVQKGRIALDRPTQHWANALISEGAVSLIPMTASIAVAAAELPDFHGDPADRIIYASSASAHASLVTADSRLTKAASTDPKVDIAW